MSEITKPETSILQLHDWLEGQGFNFGKQDAHKHLNQCSWYAWRRIKINTRECECNGPKVQLVITPYSFVTSDYKSESVEVDLTGEAGGVWWKLTAYSMKPSEIIERLDEIETSLANAWNSLRPNGETTKE